MFSAIRERSGVRGRGNPAKLFTTLYTEYRVLSLSVRTISNQRSAMSNEQPHSRTIQPLHTYKGRQMVSLSHFHLCHFQLGDWSAMMLGGSFLLLLFCSSLLFSIEIRLVAGIKRNSAEVVCH